MPKKKNDGEWRMGEDETILNAQEPASSEEEATAQAVYYEPAMWKNIKQVFRCVKCGTYRDLEDEMILHVVSHLPADEQVKVLDQLTKKEN